MVSMLKFKVIHKYQLPLEFWALVLFFAIHFHSVSGLIPRSGRKCAEKVLAQSIDLRKMTGQWYEIEASPALPEWPYKCVSIKLSAFFEKKSKIKVEAMNRLKEEGLISQLLNVSLPQGSEGKDGKLIIGWAPQEDDASVGRVPYAELYKLDSVQIVATDYENWAIIWSCRPYEKADARTEQVWILSRYRTLDSPYFETVQDTVVSLNLEAIKTVSVNQNGCTAEEGMT